MADRVDTLVDPNRSPDGTLEPRLSHDRPSGGLVCPPRKAQQQVGSMNQRGRSALSPYLWNPSLSNFEKRKCIVMNQARNHLLRNLDKPRTGQYPIQIAQRLCGFANGLERGIAPEKKLVEATRFKKAKQGLIAPPAAQGEGQRYPHVGGVCVPPPLHPLPRADPCEPG